MLLKQITHSNLCKDFDIKNVGKGAYLYVQDGTC